MLKAARRTGQTRIQRRGRRPVLRGSLALALLALAFLIGEARQPAVAEAHYLRLGPTEARFWRIARVECARRARYLGSSDYFYVRQACSEVKGVVCVRGAVGLLWTGRRRLDPAAGLAGHPWNPDVELPRPGPFMILSPTTNHAFSSPTFAGPAGELYRYAGFMGGLSYVRQSVHAKRSHTAICVATLYAPAPDWARAYDDHYLNYAQGPIVMARTSYVTRPVVGSFQVTGDRS